MVSPEHARALDLFKRTIPGVDDPISEWRRLFDDMCGSFAVPDAATIEPIDADGVPCLKVAMPGAAADKLLIHYHSGGYVMGSAKGYREFACRLSAATGATVLLPDYRLAPDHAYPAAADDALTAYNWAARHWPPASIIVSGDSAGGGLCVATLMAVRDAGGPVPAGGIAISPLLDLAGEGQSCDTNKALDPLIDRNMIVSMGQVYIGDIDPHDHPRASPLWGRHHGLPPLFLTVSNTEVLRDDVVRLAESVGAAGGSARTSYPEGMVHIWTIFPFLPEAATSLAEIGAFARQQWAAA
ncbi:alpha/beta hydrolase [Novosphingobium lentum]|uniref:alpha/beta hydrolase n=1 Tax=Novosphingobium lentum TaxID=145287 RepID=UPI00082E3770|nr:alpha/beta hydrolase [Novosphingobium lentum]